MSEHCHDHHDHDGHHHHHNVSGKNLFITIILNLFITIAQVIGGILSGSLALLSDALHNFSDVLALIIAYVANRLSHREGTSSKTFGYKRAEIIAALFNTSVLMSIAFILIYESINKLLHPQAVDSLLVVWLGVLSIFLNALSVLLVSFNGYGYICCSCYRRIIDVLFSYILAGSTCFDNHRSLSYRCVMETD